jgi:predicted transcriptional regulator
VESESTKAFATRVAASAAAPLEDALDERGWSKSELVRRAIQYYVERNPDDIKAFYAEGSLGEFVTEVVE